MTMQTAPLLTVEGLTVEFKQGRRTPPLRAVDDVSFTVGHGETVGLVGESGSGKSTIGRAILGLVNPTGGSIRIEDRDITRATYRERRQLSRELQVIFQDPYSSLNPTRTIGQTLQESLRLDPSVTPTQTSERVATMLGRVGLSPDAARRYPSSFSGGQRQRIAIARALMAQPRIVICDEPVSALDLSVQAQVLNLLNELQREFQLSYLFIAHDLDVVRHLSHRILVLYRGRLMEEGPAERVHRAPRHPYTQALLAAAPVPDPIAQRERRDLRAAREALGPQPAGIGCPFAQRCPHAIDMCRNTRPSPEATGSGTTVACHRWRELGDISERLSFSYTKTAANARKAHS